VLVLVAAEQDDFELFCEPEGAFSPTSKEAAALIRLHEVSEPFEAEAAGLCGRAGAIRPCAPIGEAEQNAESATARWLEIGTRQKEPSARRLATPSARPPPSVSVATIEVSARRMTSLAGSPRARAAQ